MFPDTWRCSPLLGIQGGRLPPKGAWLRPLQAKLGYFSCTIGFTFVFFKHQLISCCSDGVSHPTGGCCAAEDFPAELGRPARLQQIAGFLRCRSPLALIEDCVESSQQQATYREFPSWSADFKPTGQQKERQGPTGMEGRASEPTLQLDWILQWAPMDKNMAALSKD